jgi:hypothetical protein
MLLKQFAVVLEVLLQSWLLLAMTQDHCDPLLKVVV